MKSRILPWRNQCRWTSHGSTDGRCWGRTCGSNRPCGCRHGYKKNIVSIPVIPLHHRDTCWSLRFEGRDVPATSALAVGAGTRVPDGFVRHIGDCEVRWGLSRAQVVVWIFRCWAGKIGWLRGTLLDWIGKVRDGRYRQIGFWQASENCVGGWIASRVGAKAEKGKVGKASCSACVWLLLLTKLVKALEGFKWIT